MKSLQHISQISDGVSKECYIHLVAQQFQSVFPTFYDPIGQIGPMDHTNLSEPPVYERTRFLGTYNTAEAMSEC